MTTKYNNKTEYNRAVKDSGHTYTMVTNMLIRDPNLNIIEKGIMLELLSNDESYIINKTFLQKKSGIGEDTFNENWKHLQKLGYINSKRFLRGVEWIINEVPSIVKPALNRNTAENTSIVKPALNRNTAENTSIVNTSIVKPNTAENTSIVKPALNHNTAENNTSVNNTSVNNTSVNNTSVNNTSVKGVLRSTKEENQEETKIKELQIEEVKKETSKNKSMVGEIPENLFNGFSSSSSSGKADDNTTGNVNTGNGVYNDTTPIKVSEQSEDVSENPTKDLVEGNVYDTLPIVSEVTYPLKTVPTVKDIRYEKELTKEFQYVYFQGRYESNVMNGYQKYVKKYPNNFLRLEQFEKVLFFYIFQTLDEKAILNNASVNNRMTYCSDYVSDILPIIHKVIADMLKPEGKKDTDRVLELKLNTDIIF
jgi:hypothetical protein